LPAGTIAARRAPSGHAPLRPKRATRPASASPMGKNLTVSEFDVQGECAKRSRGEGPRARKEEDEEETEEEEEEEVGGAGAPLRAAPSPPQSKYGGMPPGFWIGVLGSCGTPGTSSRRDRCRHVGTSARALSPRRRRSRRGRMIIQDQLHTMTGNGATRCQQVLELRCPPPRGSRPATPLESTTGSWETEAKEQHERDMADYASNGDGGGGEQRHSRRNPGPQRHKKGCSRSAPSRLTGTTTGSTQRARGA